MWSRDWSLIWQMYLVEPKPIFWLWDSACVCVCIPCVNAQERTALMSVILPSIPGPDTAAEAARVNPHERNKEPGSWAQNFIASSCKITSSVIKLPPAMVWIGSVGPASPCSLENCGDCRKHGSHLSRSHPPAELIKLQDQRWPGSIFVAKLLSRPSSSTRAGPLSQQSPAELAASKTEEGCGHSVPF